MYINLSSKYIPTNDPTSDKLDRNNQLRDPVLVCHSARELSGLRSLGLYIWKLPGA